MSTIIGFPSSTAMGLKEGGAKPREPMLPLRTTTALCALRGIDSLCSVTSFLVSSLMWNLRPHPGQCLKNSIAEVLASKYLSDVEKYQVSTLVALCPNTQTLPCSASRISCG